MTAARLLGTGPVGAVWFPVWAVGADSISARDGSRDRLCAWFAAIPVHPSKASPWGEAGARSAVDEGTDSAGLAVDGPSSVRPAAGHLPPPGEGAPVGTLRLMRGCLPPDLRAPSPHQPRSARQLPPGGSLWRRCTGIAANQAHRRSRQPLRADIESVPTGVKRAQHYPPSQRLATGSSPKRRSSA